MPELPEVETVVRFLGPLLADKTIRTITPADDFEKVLHTHPASEFNRLINGRRISAVRRRGKFIVLDLDRGHLLIHLRMTGRLIPSLSPDDNPRHITARIDFEDGTRLYFKDYRKFGRLYYYDDLAPLEDRLGPEPLSPEFTPKWLHDSLQDHRRMIKALLLDQSFLAGLGNIYVDEALWTARIHPRTVSDRVSRQKSNRLQSAIVSILSSSIEFNGTTIINFSFGEGAEGEFRSQLQVFGRQEEPCPRCRTPIRKIYLVQRGTYFCPRCQRLRK